MITFKQDVFRAELKDLGYSGETRKSEFLGYFKFETDAWMVAKTQAGEESRTGQRAHVEPDIVEVIVHESIDDYELHTKANLVTSALKKLTKAERKALRDHIKSDV